MKNLNYLNYFFVGLPITLILMGFLIDPHQGNLIGYGLFSTILTGLFQVVIGIQMLIDEPKNKSLKIYTVSVILFFLIWLLNVQFLNSDILYFILLFIPPVLSLFLSIIIYKKAYK
jgi:phosphatidylserine synthase